MCRTTIEVIKWKGAWPEEAIHVKIFENREHYASDRKLP